MSVNSRMSVRSRGALAAAGLLTGVGALWERRQNIGQTSSSAAPTTSWDGVTTTQAPRHRGRGALVPRGIRIPVQQPR